MTKDPLVKKATRYLNTLCREMPGRSPGRPTNRKATDFFDQTAWDLGWETEQQEFACMDWRGGEVSLESGGERFQAHPGPYSLGCRAEAELAAVATLPELERAEATGKLLLLHGDLAREQLMPKHYAFYNPEEHQTIIRMLESKRPAAVLAATGKNPALAGGATPFPLIEDGDFDIPNVYMTDREGGRLQPLAGQRLRLAFEARRIAATGCNVIASKGVIRSRRVVVCAHIDSKPNTPGALDNAGGVVTLLLLAELLRGYTGNMGVELTALNGEDYWAASGEMKYLEANQGRLGQILLAVNVDGAGYAGLPTAYSFYGLPAELEKTVGDVFKADPGLQPGEPWPQSDHMIFAMNQRPAVAITSAAFMSELAAEITHSPEDVPELVDCEKLVAAARRLAALIETLDAQGGPTR